MRNVKEERSAEQEHLSHQWGASQSVLDDTDSDTDVAHGDAPNGTHHYQTDQDGIQQNGDHSGSADDGEHTDGESDDNMDDDMMDKISSSPSIDDGGYDLPSSWPIRTSSLTPTSTPTRTSVRDTPSSDVDSSSPFTSTPSHFPLFIRDSRPDSPCVGYYQSASPSTSSLSLSVQFNAQGQNATSPHHHLEGEYLRAADCAESDEETYGSYDGDQSSDTTELATIQPASLETTPDRPQARGRLGDLDQDDLQDLLLPVPDPLLEESFADDDEPTNAPQSPCPSDTDSWETESGSESSWDEHGPQDDDADAVFLSLDSRFVDSGWGGECLREVEDIDFEFVYALHTFVATVEGQANATKGDTMVLLDDSNSYWWLVRVVKDSSIGTFWQLFESTGPTKCSFV